MVYQNATGFRIFLADFEYIRDLLIVGAVVSEWLGGFEGLGVYMVRVKKSYSFDKMLGDFSSFCSEFYY